MNAKCWRRRQEQVESARHRRRLLLGAPQLPGSPGWGREFGVKPERSR